MNLKDTLPSGVGNFSIINHYGLAQRICNLTNESKTNDHAKQESALSTCLSDADELMPDDHHTGITRCGCCYTD